MKQFNDITIIGIDQGYGNMKTANTIFPTAITAYDTAPMFKGDVLEYGGKFYRVGEGHKGFVADKSTDGDFYLLTLAAIAKELEQYRLFTASLCLSVGLPLSWVGSQRESNSISNQKAMLEEFAARQGFTNIVHFTDDGISGTCFDEVR